MQVKYNWTIRNSVCHLLKTPDATLRHDLANVNVLKGFEETDVHGFHTGRPPGISSAGLALCYFQAAAEFG